MDFLDKLADALSHIRARIRATDDEEKKNQNLPPDKVRAIVSFDDETIRNTKAQSEQQNRTQNSIRKATWSAFVAAVVYAFISLLIWCQMIKQNRTAAAQLHLSIESFRLDERAWIEIQPIALPSNSAAPLGAFRYELYPKNTGKTSATDITIQALRGSMCNSISMGDSASQISTLQDKMLTEGGALSNIPRVNPVSKVLAPNTVATVPFMTDGQSPQIFPKDEWVSYLIGRIDYPDAFNVRHWIKFCFFVVDAKGNLWNCREGNDEDSNPELPPS